MCRRFINILTLASHRNGQAQLHGAATTRFAGYMAITMQREFYHTPRRHSSNLPIPPAVGHNGLAPLLIDIIDALY